MKGTGTPQHWRELEQYESLLERAERIRPSGLAFDELRSLSALYRRHMAQLARSRQRGADPDAIRHLNALGVRGYTLLYGLRSRSATRGSDARRLVEALGRGWRPFQIAVALLAMGVFLGSVLASRDRAFLWTIVPSTLGYTSVMLDDLASSEDAQAKFLERTAADAGFHFYFGSALFAHNTQVGLLALAAGMLAAVPTLLLTIYNGLVVGALGSVFLTGPSAVEFLAWILPHGIPEFTAIALCASGGMLLGSAVAAPGRRNRRRALRDSMDAALLLFAIAVPLFFLAALMESFVRESLLSVGTRLCIAAAEFAMLTAGALCLRALARRGARRASWLAELRQAAA